MNPIMAAASKLMAHHDEAAKLTRLRIHLAEIGIAADLRDNNTALAVHRPEPSLPLWVFIGYGGAYYSWQNAEKRHPADDPAGAARALAEYIRR